MFYSFLHLARVRVCFMGPSYEKYDFRLTLFCRIFLIWPEFLWKQKWGEFQYDVLSLYLDL